ncbi:hypothetical protein Sjap_022362 [Stephania japonica]|uniref:Uncharacterized protein n=1 Tax=Stephania japonica TaxID=461633 RepID=A0AAP0ENS1_9MAGN
MFAYKMMLGGPIYKGLLTSTVHFSLTFLLLFCSLLFLREQDNPCGWFGVARVSSETCFLAGDKSSVLLTRVAETT